MSTTQQTAPLNETYTEGTVIRIVTRSVSGEAQADMVAGKVDGEYIVEAYVFGDEVDGRDYLLLDIPDRTFGGTYWAYSQDVAPVATKQEREDQQKRDRDVLTPARLVKHVASGAMHDESDLDIDEVDWSTNDGTATISGATASGARFTATIAVTDLQFDDC